MLAYAMAISWEAHFVGGVSASWLTMVLRDDQIPWIYL